MPIQLKRVYEPPGDQDGRRVLVERLWPRGIRKADLAFDEWAKDVAPSAELRRWFAHDPAKWEEFERRYRAELDENPGAWQALLEASRQDKLTLLFSSHDTAHNNAVVLKEYLEEHAR